MKFLSVLLSLLLCFSVAVCAMPQPEDMDNFAPPMGAPGEFSGDMPPMQEGGEIPFSKEMPEEFSDGNFPNPSVTSDGGSQQNQQMAPNDFQGEENAGEDAVVSDEQRSEGIPQNGNGRPPFSEMGGDFQPPQNGEFPDFGGRAPWEQSAAAQEGNGIALLWKEYSVVFISLGILLVAFVFVGLYRRRHY